MSRRPGEGRYAHVEREQRWLLERLPPELVHKREITDHYWLRTRLRLRKVVDGDDVTFKLGQKVRREGVAPDVLKITNVYLSSEEYDQLLVVASSIITKYRWTLSWEGRAFALDEFTGRHDGLLLGEVEISEGDVPVVTPPWATTEVTADSRYSGGWLAHASDDQLRDLLG